MREKVKDAARELGLDVNVVSLEQSTKTVREAAVAVGCDEPTGIELVRTVFKDLDFPIPVKEIRLAKDPLNATAKGALVAAQLEMAAKNG